ncbi:MAG: lipocalin-like domain-containing protein [Acidihalobacter sp.]|uniref:lipocalin-like domain-containing protein n=1 Tax=Acidihalobacter sp. TaxID=1872108 RepID=UPI00307E0277
MMRGLLLAVAVCGSLMLSACGQGGDARRTGIDLQQALGGGDTAGFARALAPRPFVFPADYGPHLHFRTEWWYFTGNLHDTQGRPYGFELTFFRVALDPHKPTGASRWLTNQLYMAHFAVTDVPAGRFFARQRFVRGALGLAGARARPFRVWTGDWSVRGGANGGFPWRLYAADKQAALELALKPGQGVILNGDRGLSRKGSAPGDASYYYSMPRLAATGSLRLGGRTLKVSGTVWLDREWSTSALAPEQIGWDWFALRLSDGSDLMFYRLRDRGGSTDSHSAGTWVSPRGRVEHLGADAVKIDVLNHWDSPRGGRYPARWRLRVPELGLNLEVQPLLADQELDLAVRYWEGAVRVRGTRAGSPVSGDGYVELTGYAGKRPARR